MVRKIFLVVEKQFDERSGSIPVQRQKLPGKGGQSVFFSLSEFGKLLVEVEEEWSKTLDKIV